MKAKRWSVGLWMLAALLLANVGNVRAQEARETIVLEDKAARTKLEADSLTIDVPEVLNLGVEIGRSAVLVDGGESESSRVRLVATSVVLEDIKGPRKAEDGLFSATHSLKLSSQTAIDAVQNLKRADKQRLYLVPLPEGLRALERAQVQRLFEHAYIRAVTGDGNTASGRDELVRIQNFTPGGDADASMPIAGSAGRRSSALDSIG